MRAFHSMRRFALLCLLLFPLSLLAAGCGGSEGTLSGTVSYKGKLLKAGTISFYPEGKSGNYSTVITTDGTYSIDKLPVGPAKISVIAAVSTGPPPGVFRRGREGGGVKAEHALKDRMTEDAKKAAEAEAKEQAEFPEKYMNPDKSGLTINVTGGKQTHDIKME
jgi:hypothetical protein